MHTTPSPPPEMTCGFLTQLDIYKKTLSLWFIGVDVKQEMRLKNDIYVKRH